MKEEWKDIPKYEGLYQVSNMGRVRSLSKEWVTGIGARRKHNGKILKPSTTTKGYQMYTLYGNGNKVNRQGHQLVAMAFLGHKPDGMDIVVDHIDRNPSNNNVSNLQLITNRENTSKDRVGCTSKYTGVNWHKQRSKWRSHIHINGRLIHLGLFDNEEEAGSIYQSALSNINKFDGNPKEFRDYLNSI